MFRALRPIHYTRAHTHTHGHEANCRGVIPASSSSCWLVDEAPFGRLCDAQIDPTLHNIHKEHAASLAHCPWYWRTCHYYIIHSNLFIYKLYLYIYLYNIHIMKLNKPNLNLTLHAAGCRVLRCALCTMHIQLPF